VASSRRWLTRANALSGLRVLAAPLLALALVRGESLVAAGLFALAVASDLADGRVARRYGEVTPVGGLLDHAADALFVSAGLAALAWRGLLPAGLPWLVVAAFLQYALDSRAAPGRGLRASRLGRWNGIAYFVAVGVPVGRDALRLSWPPDAWVAFFGWVLVASTLLSMADRALALRGRDSSRTVP
jgi:phosphatidylglycerophosphate synthase